MVERWMLFIRDTSCTPSSVRHIDQRVTPASLTINRALPRQQGTEGGDLLPQINYQQGTPYRRSNLLSLINYLKAFCPATVDAGRCARPSYRWVGFHCGYRLSLDQNSVPSPHFVPHKTELFCEVPHTIVSDLLIFRRRCKYDMPSVPGLFEAHQQVLWCGHMHTLLLPRRLRQQRGTECCHS